MRRRAARIAGLVIVACAATLLADAVVAGRRAPLDDKLIKSLQERVKNDAALAPQLEAEQKRITTARMARKSRDNVLAWALIAAAALFLACAERRPLARGHASEKAPTLFQPRPSRGGEPAAHEVDLAFVDELVAQHGRGKENAILFLQAIQAHYRYLPDAALRRLCERTEITPAQIAGTSSFYAHLRRSPAGKHILRVCHGTACHVAGARPITDELRRYLAIPPGADTDPQRLFTVDEVACLGCCSLAPVLMLDDQTAGRLTPASACAALARFERKETA